MNAQQSGVRDPATPRPWRAAAMGFVLLYCPVLAIVFATMSFSAEDSAREEVVHVANRLPAPLPPLPIVHLIERPDTTMQRDPFQPLKASTERVSSKPAPAAAADTPAMRFVASYQETGLAYAIGRDATGELAKFGVGDRVDAGEIKRIDAERVIVESGGMQKAVEILPAELGRVE